MIVEEIQIKTSESARTVKELRKELKDLKDQLLNTQQGTEEYASAMQRAANIQKDLKEQMQEINNSAMDFGQKMGNATKAMAGISGAITAATGALSLFGIENEEAQKKITATMTSLIGITEGLSKVDDGVKAFKRLTIAINAGSKAMSGFKAALLASGIGALVVILGSVIAYWDEFTDAIGLSSEQMEHLGDVAKGVINVITSGIKGIARSMGKLVKGDFAGAWAELKDGFSVVKNFNEGVAKSEAKREEERTRKAKEEADKRAKIAAEEAKKRIEALAKMAKYERDLEEARTRGDASGKYTQGAYEREMKYFDTLFSLYAKDSEEYRNLILEKERFLQDWENHFLEEAKKEEEANQKKAEDARKQAEAEAERAHQERMNLLKGFEDDLKTEQQKIDERYQMLVDAAEKEGKDTTDITAWYEKEKTRIIEEEEEKQMQIRQKALANYYTLAGSIGDIIGSIGDMMEEGTNEQKGLAIASTTIQTLVGVATALAGAFTTKSGPWDIALAAAQAASIAASGIAAITKISAVKSDGTGASPSVPNVNMGAVMQSAPEFTQTVAGATTTAAITDSRVYVLEHDITETQKRVEVAEARATY